MKRIPILAAAATRLFLTGVAGFLLSACVPLDMETELKLRVAAAVVNRGCPKRLDAQTELLKVTGTKKTMTYKYRMETVSAGDDSIRARVGTLRPATLEKNCDQPKVREEFLDKGIVLRHSYYDSAMVHVLDINVRKVDCDSLDAAEG